MCLGWLFRYEPTLAKMREFVLAVISGDFPAVRYKTESCAHLRALAALPDFDYGHWASAACNTAVPLGDLVDFHREIVVHADNRWNKKGEKRKENS